MNRFDLFSALGDLPDKTVAWAKFRGGISKKPIFITLGTVAACLILTVALNFNFFYAFLFGCNSEDTGDAGGVGGAKPSSLIYYDGGEGEYSLFEVGDKTIEECLLIWKNLNAVGEEVEIYLISTLSGDRISGVDLADISPDGIFSVSVSITPDIKNYYSGREESFILESLRLTVKSWFSARVAGEVKVSVSVD